MHSTPGLNHHHPQKPPRHSHYVTRPNKTTRLPSKTHTHLLKHPKIHIHLITSSSGVLLHTNYFRRQMYEVPYLRTNLMFLNKRFLR